jgi:hypothetical protein
MANEISDFVSHPMLKIEYNNFLTMMLRSISLSEDDAASKIFETRQ